jgi:hypothetical protein
MARDPGATPSSGSEVGRASVGGGAQIRWSPDLIWGVLALIAALALGAGSIYAVRRWRQRYAAEAPPPAEQLEHFRTLFAQGKLTREELERIERVFATPEPPAAAPPENPPP